MKIAFVHKRFGLDGGTERQLEQLVRGLRDRGHDVHVHAGTVDPRFARDRWGTFHSLPAGGPGAGLRALRLLLGAALRVRLSAYDVVVHMGRTGPRDVYRAGGGCHRLWYEMLLSRCRSGLQRLRLLLSLRHRIALWHERRALTTAQVVVGSERARQDLLASYGALADGVAVIPNAVDLDRFHPRWRRLAFGEQREQLGLGPEEVVILFVGSDFWRKGLDRVLAALPLCAPHGEEPRLLVLGDDARRDTFEAQARELGVRGRVTFLPHHAAPEKLYATVDLLVLPTRHDPFANVTLEALATGVPVVTSATNGASAEIGAGPALVVLDDPDDHEALADAMTALLAPTELPARREAARAAAERHGEAEALDRWNALLVQAAEARVG